MKIFTFIPLLFFSITLIGQDFSESDLKTLAKELSQKMKGIDTGNGISIRGCIAIGRRLVYQYDAPYDWEAPINIKEVLISNFKTAGSAKTFFLNDIDVDFWYYKGNSIIKKVLVKSNEFSTFNLELGEYMSIKDHIKSKDVNLKLKVPQGWKIEEGDRPNIVKKFTKDSNTYLILIKDNMTFFSRSESREALSDISLDELVKEFSTLLKNAEVIEKSATSIDTYPSLTLKIKGEVERQGITVPVIIRSWVVLHEDKVITLQSFGIDNAEFKALEQLYFSITNSVIFPDQYN